MEYFFQKEKVQFQRKAAFSEAKAIKFQIYFDGSKQGRGVSVVVRNTLTNDKVINRLLLYKRRLVGEDDNTAPRSELCACLISPRVYNLITEQLQTFLKEFKGSITFQILGDSLIVLNQIKKIFIFSTHTLPRLFKK